MAENSLNSPRAGARGILDLDGLWDFEFEGPSTRIGEGNTIRSPGIWQTQFPLLRNARGTGRYRRSLQVPPEWGGKTIVLVLEGVFHESVVFVDEVAVAAHPDGWTPIEVDLTRRLEGKRSFVLGVDARAPDDHDRGRFSLSLAGKQEWYGVHGGIWKSARLEARAALHLAQVTATTSYDLATGTIAVKGWLSADEPASLTLVVTRDDAEILRETFALEAREFDATLAVASPKPWSPEAPNLYSLKVELVRDGEVVDSLERTVGFRQFAAREGRLFLNGQPFYLLGALDQDWHPQEECRPPSPEFLEQRFRHAKLMGLNALRCHVKIPDRLYFDLADRLGLVVWLDMPYPQFLAPATRENLRRIFRHAVAEHGSHPSICVWTLFNEGWGIELDDNADDRRWLIDTFDQAKALVPGGLVVDNSPCFPRNYHLKTDIEDFHWYNAFPSQNEAFAATASAFAARAPWAWSPHGDAQRQGDEPLISSEFGVWGLPRPREILEADGSEPWWFESGHEWNLGAAYPHGIETRFRDAGLTSIFGGLDRFISAAQQLQWRALKYQIETLRWQRSICGYVITELNDVQWESNGLMDVKNRPRDFALRLAALQTPWLVIARAPRTAVAAGENFKVEVRLAGAEAPPAGAKLVWRFGGAEGRTALSAEPIEIKLAAPRSDAVAIVPLELAAMDEDGRTLSRNALEFCVVPPLGADVVSLFALDAPAETMLAALDWPKRATSAATAAAVIATRLTTPVRGELLAGRRVLLIADSADALVDPARHLPLSDHHNFPQMLITAREGTPWDGQWMGAFSWRRTDGPWAALPNGPMLDEHWAGLLPNYVLTGFPSTAFQGLVGAGVTVAWLHHAAALAKRSFLGKAWLTVSTFPLTSAAAAKNPLAPYLLAALSAN